MSVVSLPRFARSSLVSRAAPRVRLEARHGWGCRRWSSAQSVGVFATDAEGSSSADVPTTDATFRYRTFEWLTSCGERHEYEYVIAQQPAGGQTARKDALSALEEGLPRPPSGWTVVLIPSVSLVCSGKEEMRPLAAALAQRGHRCYILEWPGWAVSMLSNWALVRCKPEELANEYEDFWCQTLSHVAAAEAKDAAGLLDDGQDTSLDASSSPSSSSTSSPGAAPRICVVGAGSSGLYAMRSIKSMQAWFAASAQASEAPEQSAVEGAGPEQFFESLVMIAPSWSTSRPSGVLSRLSPERASRKLGTWLHSESRFGRIFRSMHFSKNRLRRQLDLPDSPDAERLELAAFWLFERRRPYVQTDGAVLHGLLDPPGKPSAPTLAADLADINVSLPSLHQRRSLILAPQGDAGGPSRELNAAITANTPNVAGKQEFRELDSPHAKPHEVAPTSILFHLDQWLSSSGDATSE
mmetsp:Transcript_52666/g.125835  ORF Transcript_52666/g.125835 Transcript_52666/m.125835 type:complete len:468 (-) Transcript_52666:2-1405(-)